LIGRGGLLNHAPTISSALKALHDALLGHRAAVQKDILHRDISIGNVLVSLGDEASIFTDVEPQDRKQAGFLIDFAYAIELSRSAPSGAPHRTGTPIFMAMGVLREHGPHPIHDLHSFFYVLLYLT
ncbi:hypothetical protein BJ508DRAFT_196072, partial [Ascobolus immersus RN42]